MPYHYKTSIRGSLLKHRRSLVSFVFAIGCTFIFSTVVFAYTMILRGSVTLAANQASVTSSQYGGKVGQGKLYNHAQSAGNAKLYLDENFGNGWSTLTTIISEPGQTEWTEVWGNAGDRLFRISVHSTYKPIIGYPGRISTGYVYTGIN